jgi:hypothetical protein
MKDVMKISTLLISVMCGIILSIADDNNSNNSR